MDLLVLAGRANQRRVEIVKQWNASLQDPAQAGRIAEDPAFWGRRSMVAETAILFDLGGVLIEWDPRRIYSSYFKHPAELERFLAEVCTAEWNRGLDAGRPFAEALAEKQAEFPDLAEPIGWWGSRWSEMLGGAVPGTVEVLRDLVDRGHPTFALTNWSAETFPIARTRFPFLDWFQDIVVSGEVGMAKPDPAIFRLAAKRCGLVPEHTLFIDDHAPNLQAARALGFQTHLFQSARDLRLELEERGLLGHSVR